MYGKLFTAMYEGSLVDAGWEALVTLQQLVILSDKRGVVDMTAEALARRTTIPIGIIKTGLAALEKPDPDSRTPAEEGRRIARLSPDRAWGWRIVNYATYRNLRSQEERNDYMRDLMRDRRAEEKKRRENGAATDDIPLAVVSNVSLGSKQEAVSRKQKARNPHNSRGTESERAQGQNLKSAAMEILTDIHSKRVATRTPSGTRYHIPAPALDALPPKAKRALDVIGGAGQVANAEGQRWNVLLGQFATAYAGMPATQPDEEIQRA